MCKPLLFVLAVCATIFGAHPSQAQQLLESYKAFLSERDHFNSSGQRLTTAAAVIRQDRANYHRFGVRDQGDESDIFFADSANRTALERLLERGRADPGVISRIVNGTPTVRVELWRGNSGPFVVVTLIDPTKEEAKATNAPPPTASSPEQKPSGSELKTGTGFYVSLDGHVMTNNHVIEGCSNIKVIRIGAQEANAYIVAKDKTNDMAIIKTTISPPIVPAQRGQVKIGESVFVFGFPLTGLLSTSGNFTIGTVTAITGIADDTRLVQISAPVQPGNSGGALVDKFGNVVGVIVSKLNALNVAAVTNDIPQNVNFAIKSSIAINFLESNNVSPTLDTKTRELSPEAIAELAKLFTVRVTCN